MGQTPRRVYVGEIGKPAQCYITEDGGLVTFKGSRSGRRFTFRTLPASFGVNTTKELFEMFFPENRKRS